MVVKNLILVESHLIKDGFLEAKATPHEFTKFFGQNVCRVDLTGPAIESSWCPMEDYSAVSTDFSEYPLMAQLFLDIDGLSATGELPTLIGRSTEPDETPPPVKPSAPDTTVPVVELPRPIPSIPPKDQDKTSKKSGSGSGVPHQGSILPPEQKDAGKQPTSDKKEPPASPPDTPKAPPLPLGNLDVMNKVPPVPKGQNRGSNPIPKSKPLENPPAVIGAEDLDRELSEKKVNRWLQGQGGTYNVHGNTRPDAASVQGAANRNGVSTEILKAVQTEDYAEVIVRTHFKGQYVDTVVHNDFKNSRQLLLLEMATKHPEVVDSYSNEGFPVFIPGATFKDSVGKTKNVMLTVMHSLLSDIQFSIRDCTTKAASAGQTKILNQEWRSDTEVESEQHESQLVETRRNNRK